MLTPSHLKQSESFPDQLKYSNFCFNEYQLQCEREYQKRLRCLNQADSNFTSISDHIKAAEGVYIYIDSISNSQRRIIKRFEVPRDENVLFLDLNLSFLQPTPFYKKLMQSIDVDEDRCIASISGFSQHQRENGKWSVFPIISGGSFNPYLKYKSNRACASRRLKKFDHLTKLIGSKIFPMNINLTFPQEISAILFNDPDGVKKTKKINSLVFQRILDENVLTLDNSSYASSLGLQFGMFSNVHEWGSRNPFKDHIHIHNIFPNFLYDPIHKKFVRIKPYLSKEQRNQIKSILHETIETVLEVDCKKDSKSLNIYHQYLGGYTADLENPEPVSPSLTNMPEFMQYKDDLTSWKLNNNARSKLLHSLKYTNRSYLIDVANHLEYTEADYPDSYEDFIQKADQFKKFTDRGAISNRTSCTGFLRNLKTIIKETKWNLYLELYDPLHGDLKKIDRDAFSCSVTGEKMSKEGKEVTDFVAMKQLSIFIAYKSGMIKLGELKFSSTPFNSQGFSKGNALKGGNF